MFSISEQERSSDDSGDWFFAELIVGMRALSCD
jgi:hypothetical protein